jgi:hypothetical protein
MNASALPCLADRPTALSLQRGQKMARSAHAYVRGSTVKFYEWLEAQKRRSLPEGLRCGYAETATRVILGLWRTQKVG